MTLESLSSILQTFRIWDLVDILVITALFYALLGMFRKTRAGQLLTGAGVLLLLYLLASLVNMRMITFLMSSLLQVGVMAVVILFQPELRRMLEQLAQTRKWAVSLFKTRSWDSSDRGGRRRMIIAVCDAAERFSESRTGALIVFERNVNLSEIIRTGTPVDSEINPEILGTIFYEGTPLHDGAVVIRGTRICAAGCVLPLSNNLDLGKDLGTRHRASLGIAENSDAVAVVVSEETGTISVTKNGVMMRHFDRETLYERLIDELIPAENPAEGGQMTWQQLLHKAVSVFVKKKEESGE